MCAPGMGTCSMRTCQVSSIKPQVLEVQDIPLIYTGTKLACYFKQHVSVGIMFMTGILV